MSKALKSPHKHCMAIVLSAGQGKRMGSAVQKQYIELEGKPVIYYTLKAFQDSEIIDEIILVVGVGQEQFAREEIVKRYHFTKVAAVVAGGAERYDSVWQGLKAIRDAGSAAPKEAVEIAVPQNAAKAANAADQEISADGDSYVFIHDGARMFVDEGIIRRGYETVLKHRAGVAGMPSKDTVKIVDDDGFAVKTPQRKYVWTVQTPQIFETSLIIEAYSKLMQEQDIAVTDDAMVVEQMLKAPVRLFEGSYENIKITTPEDLEIAEGFLRKKRESAKLGQRKCL